MKVHTKVVHLPLESELQGSLTFAGKIDLVAWLNNGDKAGPHLRNYFFEHLDRFEVEAHLEAPGTAVQPTGTGTATWSGKAIAHNNATSQLLVRGGPDRRRCPDNRIFWGDPYGELATDEHEERGNG